MYALYLPTIGHVVRRQVERYSNRIYCLLFVFMRVFALHTLSAFAKNLQKPLFVFLAVFVHLFSPVVRF